MIENRLATVLTHRLRRPVWTTLAGYALLVVVAFALASEAVLRRSLEHSADVIQSLLGQYADSAHGPGSVMPAAMAEQLVGMGAQVAITRTTTTAGGTEQVYYLSPGMPAKRLAGLPAAATPEDVRQIILAAIAHRARWRYRVMHRAAGAFDIYIAAGREPYLVACAAVAIAALLLLPAAAWSAGYAGRQAVAAAIRPLERVVQETRAVGPAELGQRITSPTGQADITELADTMNRMLERVDRAHRALESFTADASHELRTPLTHLRAQVQWASGDGRSDGEVREALAAMERALDRTTKMVDDLLLIARGENRKLALQRVPFDLAPLVDDVREVTEAMVVGRDLVVEQAPLVGTWALGDADRTRHILLNIVSNAVRYTPSGAIALSIESGGERAGVSVRDTGPGIAPEHLDRIFDRFYRIDQSRSRDLGGTGLGLAIARLLAELQDGRITVASRPGAGSTFTLWLPAAGPR